MSAMTPADKNSPLVRAWEKYKSTDEYSNTRRALQEKHVDGSLWAAFSEGFTAAPLQNEAAGQAGQCDTCQHKKHPDGGWCYMFKEQPPSAKANQCPQFAGSAPSASPVEQAGVPLYTVGTILGHSDCTR